MAQTLHAVDGEVARPLSDPGELRANGEGRTPLHLAAASGFTSLARLLLGAGALPDAADPMGRTPLHLAAWDCRADPVKLLLDRGASASAKDRGGLTPLHSKGLREADRSCTWPSGFAPALPELLIDKGAKVGARDVTGRTPCMLCAMRRTGARREAELLVCHGADPTATDAFEWTAADLARMTEQTVPRTRSNSGTGDRVGEIDVPAIVSRELFEAMQAQRNATRSANATSCKG